MCLMSLSLSLLILFDTPLLPISFSMMRAISIDCDNIAFKFFFSLFLSLSRLSSFVNVVRFNYYFFISFTNSHRSRERKKKETEEVDNCSLICVMLRHDGDCLINNRLPIVCNHYTFSFSAGNMRKSKKKRVH